MVVALYLIALAMIGGGAASVAYGYGIILTERGWTMVIAGTVAFSSGFLLFGIAVVAGRIRRLARELVEMRERAGRLGAAGFSLPPGAPPVQALATPDLPAAPIGGGSDELAVLKAADVIPEPAPAAPPAVPKESEAAGRSIIGTYNSGGNAYVMYSDGSIEADTPTGRYTFQSLDELKDFIAAGGEAPNRRPE